MSVQPPLKFIPPQFNSWVLRSLHAIVPILMRVRLFDWLPARIARVETENPEILVDLYRQFQAGKIRLIFAFRHSEVDDPIAGLYLLSREIPRIAKQMGVKLKTPLHAHFILRSREDPRHKECWRRDESHPQTYFLRYTDSSLSPIRFSSQLSRKLVDENQVRSA